MKTAIFLKQPTTVNILQTNRLHWNVKINETMVKRKTTFW